MNYETGEDRRFDKHFLVTACHGSWRHEMKNSLGSLNSLFKDLQEILL